MTWDSIGMNAGLIAVTIAALKITEIIVSRFLNGRKNSNPDPPNDQVVAKLELILNEVRNVRSDVSRLDARISDVIRAIIEFRKQD